MNSCCIIATYYFSPSAWDLLGHLGWGEGHFISLESSVVMHTIANVSKCSEFILKIKCIFLCKNTNIMLLYSNCRTYVHCLKLILFQGGVQDLISIKMTWHVVDIVVLQALSQNLLNQIYFSGNLLFFQNYRWYLLILNKNHSNKIRSGWIVIYISSRQSYFPRWNEKNMNSSRQK